MYKLFFKRFTDVVFCSLALVLLFLPLLTVALLIKIESLGKGSVIFKQRRIGQNKKEFYIYKFRTMKLKTPSDVPTHLLKDPRSYITKVGRVLRKTSLDELPQIFNILKGEMSIVGPRPALWNQYDLIKARDKNGANNIKPGLTGLAQIKGRDELPIPVKAKYDGEYARKISFLFDMYIIIKTAQNVFTAKGVRDETIT